jgi:hypothetical protein
LLAEAVEAEKNRRRACDFTIGRRARPAPQAAGVRAGAWRGAAVWAALVTCTNLCGLSNTAYTYDLRADSVGNGGNGSEGDSDEKAEEQQQQEEEQEREQQQVELEQEEWEQLEPAREEAEMMREVRRGREEQGRQHELALPEEQDGGAVSEGGIEMDGDVRDEAVLPTGRCVQSAAIDPQHDHSGSPSQIALCRMLQVCAEEAQPSRAPEERLRHRQRPIARAQEVKVRVTLAVHIIKLSSTSERNRECAWLQGSKGPADCGRGGWPFSAISGVKLRYSVFIWPSPTFERLLPDF